MDPFPLQITRLFKYSATHSLSTNASTGGNGAEQRYLLNSLYDPDYTGTGHQPYSFDQVMANYTKYRVNRVSYRITFTTPGSTADMLCTATLAGSTDSSIANTSIHVPLEWPNTTHGHLSSAGSRICVLSGSIDLHTMIGVSKARYDTDDIFVGSTSTSPSQLALLSFAVGSYSGATSQAASVLVELEFDALIFGRLIVAPS